MKTLCIDFDGVIHSYVSPWVDAETIPDPPVPGAMAFLAEATKRFDVAIFSSRSSQSGGIGSIRDWLIVHGIDATTLAGVRFPVSKPPAVVYLDDRGWRFDGTFPDLDVIEAFVPWNRTPQPCPSPPALAYNYSEQPSLTGEAVRALYDEAMRGQERAGGPRKGGC